MTRLARLVVPGLPHHVTQRGNRKQKTFFSKQDYEAYVALVRNNCRKHNVEIWAYCLMPNHVHLIAVPKSEDGLRLAIGKAHRHYTIRVNLAQGWSGYLWQGRFGSCVMDDVHLLACARYIELNPVRAGLVDKPEAYHWSSARAHLMGQNDGLIKSSAILDKASDWQKFLSEGIPEAHITKLRSHQRTGRPLGSEDFTVKLEGLSGRSLRQKKRGPKIKTSN